nr:hypothetical protein [Pedobacter sp. ASV19]
MEDTKGYIEAFKFFTQATDNDFTLEKKGKDGAFVQFEEREFRVCRYEDLLWEFKTYFDNDFDLIYTETPFDLWGILLKEHEEMTTENLVIDIYKAWKLYWDSNRNQYTNETHYLKLRNLSWTKFEELIAKVTSNPEETLQAAIEISDMDFVPILALTIRSQFKDEEKFYMECLDILIEGFPYHFADDGNFDVIEVDTPSGNNTKYYIFEIES